MIRPQDIVDILQGKAGSITILCGAGISIESGLPAVSTLLTRILKALDVDRDDICLLRDEEGQWRMPFERFIEAFIGHDQDTTLFEIFKLGYPNRNHYLIRELAKEGVVHEICTTNFDTLIEEALSIQPEVPYEVTTEEDSSTVPRSSLPIIKLHGTSSEVATIKSTISSISSGQGYENRVSLLRDILSSNSDILWVWGYSCSDELDINPVIRKMSPLDKTVVYVDHDERINDIGNAIIKPISDVNDKSPFRSCDGYKIRVNAKILVEQIRPDVDFEEPNKVSEEEWVRIIKRWVRRFKSPHLKYSISCHLFFNLSEYEAALKYNDRIFNTPSTNKKGLGAAWSNRGMIFIELEETKRALQCFQNAIDLFRTINFPHGVATSYNHLGYSFAELGHEEVGLKYISIGLRYLSDHDYRMHDLCKGHLLMSKGKVLHDKEKYEEAIEAFDNSLSLFTENGHMPQASKVLKLKGKTYRQLNERENARNTLQEALSLAKSVGNIEVIKKAEKMLREM